MDTKKTFKNTNGRGFHITFPNGVTLSTQLAWGNYCENQDTELAPLDFITKSNWESDDAEIAMFDAECKWITREFKDNGDDVLGHVRITEWLEAFDWCRNRKSK